MQALLKKYPAGKRDIFVKWSDGFCKKTLRTGGTLPRVDRTFPFEWARWNFGTVLCEPQSLTGKAKDTLNAWLEVRQRSFAFACNLMEGKVPISQAKLGAKHSDMQSTQLNCRAKFQMIRSSLNQDLDQGSFQQPASTKVEPRCCRHPGLVDPPGAPNDPQG